MQSNRPSANDSRRFKKRVISTLICFVGVLVAAVASILDRNSAYESAHSESFFPLRPGMQWTYSVSNAGGFPAVLRLHVEANGGNLTIVSLLSTGSGDDELSAMAVDPNFQSQEHYTVEAGFFSREEDLPGGLGSIRFQERRLLPAQLSPNQEWSNTLSPAAFLKITQHHRSFLETGTMVVPAGRFSDCIRVETDASYSGPSGDSGSRYFTDWYAPNVGLVKTVVFRRTHEDWLLERSAIVRTLLDKTGLLEREIAKVELTDFVRSSHADDSVSDYLRSSKRRK
jgi:hypothetical protein